MVMDLNKQLDQAKRANTSNAREEYKEIEDKKDELQAAIDDLKAGNQGLEETVKVLKQQLEEKDSTIAELATQLSNADSEGPKFNQEIAKLQKEKETSGSVTAPLPSQTKSGGGGGKPEDDAEAIARLEDLMTLELNRMREDVQNKTELLKAKDAEMEELHTKLESLQGDKNQKLEYLEHLMKEREMALSQLREQSDLQIRNLSEELVLKDETLRIERERLEAEVDGFRRKALDLERQYSELSDERRQMQNLQERVSQLTKELESAQSETRAAIASKLQTVQHLSDEMERLRDNYGCLIYIRKPFEPAPPAPYDLPDNAKV